MCTLMSYGDECTVVHAYLAVDFVVEGSSKQVYLTVAWRWSYFVLVTFPVTYPTSTSCVWATMT
jgi:hypothetical protein